MINDNSTGYWDYSNEIAPQWMEYGSPGARSAPGTINVGGMGSSPAITGAGGMPVGGANPILSTFGPPSSYANPAAGSQFTPNPFMTPGLTFQPQTQFGQQASAPLNLSQQGRTYGQMPGGPNMAQQAPAFQSVRPGGSSGFMPQFQNPFGPQPQQPQQTNTDLLRRLGNPLPGTPEHKLRYPEIGTPEFEQLHGPGANADAQRPRESGPITTMPIGRFADGGMTGMPAQFQNPFGPQQIPVGQSMYNPRQSQDISVGGTPQQPGLPGLLSVGSKNPYPQGYTPIGQQPQNFLSLNYNG
jgi:hypothetical protein